jgi:hypothetical protein
MGHLAGNDPEKYHLKNNKYHVSGESLSLMVRCHARKMSPAKRLVMQAK